MKPIRRILVATDYSPCALAAAEVAAQLARQVNAMVHVMEMVDTSAITDAYGDPAFVKYRIEGIYEEARQRLEAFAEQHFADIEDTQIHAVDGGVEPTIPHEIARTAGQLECDLIVMGTHGRTGFGHFVLGSVAEQTVRTSAIPVLTVRHT
ncbi:MAG: universal stress protein [Candidatus Binatia bacterium]